MLLCTKLLDFSWTQPILSIWLQKNWVLWWRRDDEKDSLFWPGIFSLERIDSGDRYTFIRIDKIWAQVLQVCWQIELAFLMQGVIKKTLNYKIIKHCPNVSITPLRQWGFWQCLPFSWAILKDKHCRHPIAVMRVVDMFGLWQLH